jgi:NADH-quinone oxidoreductase subunit G
MVPETVPDLAADLVHSLQARGQAAGIFFLLAGANSFGAALHFAPGRSFLKTLEAIENGSIACLMLIETDPFRFFPDRSRLEEALNKLDCLLVLDYLPSPTVQRADIFLPTETVFEAGGHFVNQEGRLQWAAPVYRGGVPIEQLGHGGPPPRLFGYEIPGGEPKPARHILQELARLLSPGSDLSLETLWQEMGQENPVFSSLSDLPAPAHGIRMIPDKAKEKYFKVPKLKDRLLTPSGQDSVELLLVDRTFGTEELSSYAGPLGAMAEKPCLRLSTLLGTRLGLQKGDQVTLSLDNGPLSISIDLDDRQAGGVLILPRQSQSDWQKISNFPIRLTMDKIIKTREPL